jgi:hypothetical protein
MNKPRHVLQPAPPFVGRREEIHIIEEILSTIKGGGQAFQCIVNFHGVIGIGKTTLLGHVCQTIAPKQGAPAAMIDFANPAFQRPPEGGVALLQALVQQLSEESGIAPAGFYQAVGSFQEFLGSAPPPGEPDTWWERPAKDVADAFVVYATQLLQRGPLALLFDTTEMADAVVLEWLETEVFNPLIRPGKVLIVVAGRSVVRWKRFEVRRRVRLHRLQPFDEESTREQLPQYTKLAGNIVRLTFGHPLGNVTVSRELALLADRAPLDARTFESHRERLMAELMEELIEKQIMAGVAPDLRRAFRVIAVLRQFDVNTLRYLLGSFLKEDYADRSGVYYLNMVGRMVETSLVEWDKNRKGYALDYTVRRMLALNLQLTNPSEYVSINEAAVTLYEGWIEQIPDNRSGFIVEELYHRANVLAVQGQDPAEISSALRARLWEYLKTYYGGEYGTAGAVRLKEELQTDRELEENLPDRVADLVADIDRFIGNAH